ncbi:MAG: YdcF family protein [Rhodospirillales bacterium]
MPFPRRRRRRPFRIAAVFALVTAALGLWVWGLFWYVDQLPKEAAADAAAGRKTGAVVVLTGGAGRLDEGLALLRKGRGKRLFVSGVYRGVDVRQLLKNARSSGAGLEDRIEIGNAVDTVGNARETAEWAAGHGIRSIHLVTSAYHMPRSLLEFSHNMPDVEIVPSPVFSERVKQDDWWKWPGTAVLIAGEYTKYLFAAVRNAADTVIGAAKSAAADENAAVKNGKNGEEGDSE